MIRTILKPFSFLPAICLMYIIYSFSADTGTTSSQLSYSVSTKIVTIVDEMANLELSDGEIAVYAEQFHYMVRKTAHMTEYAALAIAVSFPLYVYRLRGMGLVIVAGTLCIGFAGLDEYHQSFVAGRTAAIRDVAIDTIGVLCGIIFVRLIGWTGRMTIFRSKRKR